MNVSHYLQPFRLGGVVMGNVVYLLGWLILSNWCHIRMSEIFEEKSTNKTSAQRALEKQARHRRVRHVWLARNAVMLLSLGVFLGLGHLYHMDALTNTATVFAVLWFWGKEYAEVMGIRGSVWCCGSGGIRGSDGEHGCHRAVCKFCRCVLHGAVAE